MTDYIKAHKFSSNHKESIQKDQECGCFHSILKKLNIPYKEEDGLYTIYGYTNATHQLQ